MKLHNIISGFIMNLLYLAFLTLILFLSACDDKSSLNNELTDEQLNIKANELAHKFLIIDAHVDVPYRLERKWGDISQSTEKGHFDYPRAKDGGLDAPFMSIYIPAKYEKTGGGKKLANKLIDMIEGIANEHPDKFAVAASVDAVGVPTFVIRFPIKSKIPLMITGSPPSVMVIAYAPVTLTDIKIINTGITQILFMPNNQLRHEIS